MDIQRVETYMKRVAESETKTFTPVGDKLKVGLDLGTAYIVMVVLDEENNPIACEKQAADVLRDGVVVDYLGALNIVKALKAKLEQRIGKELVNCAIAMPAGTDDSVKTHTCSQCYLPDIGRRDCGYRRRYYRTCALKRWQGCGDRRRTDRWYAPDFGAFRKLPYSVCRSRSHQTGLFQTSGDPSDSETGY